MANETKKRASETGAADAEAPAKLAGAVEAEKAVIFRRHPAAAAAVRAPFGVEDPLGNASLAFGIVAPQAAQRAALEKDGGADAGAVADAELLNIEKKPLHLTATPPAG